LSIKFSDIKNFVNKIIAFVIEDQTATQKSRLLDAESKARQAGRKDLAEEIRKKRNEL